MGGGTETLIVKTIPTVINSSGGGIAGTLDGNYYKGCGVREGIEREFVLVSYQKVTGTLNPGGHPGSYNGQDAYNDMLVTDYERTNSNGHGTGQRRNHEGGVSVLEREP